MVPEIEMNARIQALIAQRDNALNTSVLLAGELATAKAEVAELSGRLEAAEAQKAENIVAGDADHGA